MQLLQSLFGTTAKQQVASNNSSSRPPPPPIVDRVYARNGRYRYEPGQYPVRDASESSKYRVKRLDEESKFQPESSLHTNSSRLATFDVTNSAHQRVGPSIVRQPSSRPSLERLKAHHEQTRLTNAAPPQCSALIPGAPDSTGASLTYPATKQQVIPYTPTALTKINNSAHQLPYHAKYYRHQTSNFNAAAEFRNADNTHQIGTKCCTNATDLRSTTVNVATQFPTANLKFSKVAAPGPPSLSLPTVKLKPLSTSHQQVKQRNSSTNTQDVTFYSNNLSTQRPGAPQSVYARHQYSGCYPENTAWNVRQPISMLVPQTPMVDNLNYNTNNCSSASFCLPFASCNQARTQRVASPRYFSCHRFPSKVDPMSRVIVTDQKEQMSTFSVESTEIVNGLPPKNHQVPRQNHYTFAGKTLSLETALFCGITGRDLTPTVDTAKLPARDIGETVVQYFDLRQFLGHGGKIRLYLRMKQIQHVYQAFSPDAIDMIRKRQQELMCNGGSPTGRLPVLIHNGRTFCETHAILRYLARTIGEYGFQPDAQDYFGDMLVDKLAYWTDDLMMAITELFSSCCADATLAYLQRRSGYFALFDKMLRHYSWTAMSHQDNYAHSSKSNDVCPKFTWFDAAIAATLFDDIQLIGKLRNTGKMANILKFLERSQAYQTNNVRLHDKPAKAAENALLTAEGQDCSREMYPLLYNYYIRVTSGPVVQELLLEKETIRQMELKQKCDLGLPRSRDNNEPCWPLDAPWLISPQSRNDRCNLSDILPYEVASKPQLMLSAENGVKKLIPTLETDVKASCEQELKDSIGKKNLFLEDNEKARFGMLRQNQAEWPPFCQKSLPADSQLCPITSTLASPVRRYEANTDHAETLEKEGQFGMFIPESATQIPRNSTKHSRNDNADAEVISVLKQNERRAEHLREIRVPNVQPTASASVTHYGNSIAESNFQTMHSLIPKPLNLNDETLHLGEHQREPYRGTQFLGARTELLLTTSAPDEPDSRSATSSSSRSAPSDSSSAYPHSPDSASPVSKLTSADTSSFSPCSIRRSRSVKPAVVSKQNVASSFAPQIRRFPAEREQHNYNFHTVIPEQRGR